MEVKGDEDLATLVCQPTPQYHDMLSTHRTVFDGLYLVYAPTNVNVMVFGLPRAADLTQAQLAARVRALGQPPVFRYDLGHFFLIVVSIDRHDVRIHQIAYRLAGLHMLVQKEKESVYFMEIGLKEDLEDLDMVLKLFPSLDQNEQINSLIRKFRTDQ